MKLLLAMLILAPGCATLRQLDDLGTAGFYGHRIPYFEVTLATFHF